MIRVANLFILWTLIAAVQVIAAGQALGDEKGRSKLTIVSGGEKHEFRVEVARTRKQQSRGLMYRRRLPADSGMLFVYRPPERAAMWMENTLIPLDMLFIGNDNRIVKIAERTMPLSRTIIRAPVPVRGVLELNAGTASRLGIRTGDKVVSSALD